MAINKKLIHFNQYSNFITKKLSANVDNTQYTIGVDGTVYNVDNDNKPDILYHSIVFIKDVSKIWTHGQIYNCDGGITIVDSVDKLDPDAPLGSLAILNQSQKVVESNTILKDAFAGNINSTPITKLEIHDPVYDLSLSEEISIFLVGPNVIEDTSLQLIAYNDGENNVLICVTLSPSFEIEGEITLWDSISGVYQDNVDMLNAFISDSFGAVYVCKDAYHDDENIVFIEPSEEDYSCINAFLFNVEEIPNSKLYIKSDKWRDANTYQIAHTPKGLNEYDQEGALRVCLNSLKLETVLCESLYQPIKGKEYYIDEDTGKIIKLTDKLNTIKGIVPINAKKSESFNTLYLKDFKSGLVMQIRDDNYAVSCEIFDSENQNKTIISSYIITLDKFGKWNIDNLGINTINEFIAERNFEWLGDIEHQIDKGQNFNEIFHVQAEIPVKDVALYIKKESSWEKLKTGGGSVETVDNLEDTSTDKALSANMGRVLNERISAVASGSATSIAGTLNIKDLNAVKAAQELLSNNQQVTYIITDADGNYPSPNNSTVYLDTEDNILDLLYRGNGDALKWLLKNKQAYYNYSGSWYSQTISEDLVKLPSLHLRTAQVGDLITLIRQDIPAEEFYSKFVDYNNINLNLGTAEKLLFNTYLVSIGIKGALESISDGEAIRRLIEGGYIYTAENNPEEFPETIMNPLVSSDGGLVTLYTAQITPNTQYLYNGEFWTGNMTGPGIYSYINNPDPDIPDRENGEVYTGYVSPDGTQTLVSMKNPFKAYKKVNNAWEKLETDTNYKTRYGWGTSLDSMLKTGVCAYTPATVANIDANWTIFVTCSSDGDPTYYHLMQTAICRNDDMLGRIFQRMGWYKGNGEDLHFTEWKEVGGGGSDIKKSSYYGNLDIATETFGQYDDIENLTPMGFVTVYSSNDNSIAGFAFSTILDGYITIQTTDYSYSFIKNEDEIWVLETKTPNYSERFATKDEVATAIANAIINTLNTEV